jgi:hypothetical protein
VDLFGFGVDLVFASLVFVQSFSEMHSEFPLRNICPSAPPCGTQGQIYDLVPSGGQ